MKLTWLPFLTRYMELSYSGTSLCFKEMLFEGYVSSRSWSQNKAQISKPLVSQSTFSSLTKTTRAPCHTASWSCSRCILVLVPSSPETGIEHHWDWAESTLRVSTAPACPGEECTPPSTIGIFLYCRVCCLWSKWCPSDLSSLQLCITSTLLGGL